MNERAAREGAVGNALRYGDLSFRDFVELALYDPETGYYARRENPISAGGDYLSAPELSPVFAFALAGLVRELLSRTEAAVFSIVDIGCGNGRLIHALAAQIDDARARFYGVDRNLGRVSGGAGEDRVTFLTRLEDLPPSECQLFLSNELFDAFPFARLVQRGEHLHELWVTDRDGVLDWVEREAPEAYEDYFRSAGIELAEGQFADVSLEWGAFYGDIVRLLKRGLVVSIDYGFSAAKLFHPRIRRFGTAAAYRQHRVHRDLLANPGAQDLTAHVNFTDLERAGLASGAMTGYSGRLGPFLLAIGVTQHELFRSVDQVAIGSAEEGLQLLEARENAKRLILPDGIAQEMQVLVQLKGVATEGWSFQRPLF